MPTTVRNVIKRLETSCHCVLDLIALTRLITTTLTNTAKCHQENVYKESAASAVYSPEKIQLRLGGQPSSQV